MYVTKLITTIKAQSTTKRVSFKRSFSCTEIKGFKIFCVKSADGAKRVAEAVDIMAEISAPKNIICTKIGVDSKIKVGFASTLKERDYSIVNYFNRVYGF